MATKKVKSYESYLAEYKERKAKKLSTIDKYLAPADCKPKLKGRGYTHTYIERNNLDTISVIKRTIRASSKYSLNRFYPCAKCGRYVSKKYRREQKDKFIIGKGYKDLRCPLHIGKVM